MHDCVARRVIKTKVVIEDGRISKGILENPLL